MAHAGINANRVAGKLVGLTGEANAGSTGNHVRAESPRWVDRTGGGKPRMATQCAINTRALVSLLVAHVAGRTRTDKPRCGACQPW